MSDHSDSRPTLLSVCSGIGGLDLALERVLGARPVGYVERDAYAQAVLLARMEDEALGCAPVLDDLSAFDGGPFRGLVDIVAGGIPCQPHSVAGKQKRGEDERDLIDEFLRVVGEVGPGLVVVENVRGFVAGDGLGRLLGGLADLGFDAEWSCVRASDVGAPHRRERVFVAGVADASHDQRRRRVSGEKGGTGQNAERGRRLTGGGEDLEHAERERLEGILQAGPASGAARRTGGEFPAPWPPGPSGDWSGVPEWCWPALEPRLRGVADELSAAMEFRTDRLRCLGNAVVPAQAEAALRLLLQRAGGR